MQVEFFCVSQVFLMKRAPKSNRTENDWFNVSLLTAAWSSTVCIHYFYLSPFKWWTPILPPTLQGPNPVWGEYPNVPLCVCVKYIYIRNRVYISYDCSSENRSVTCKFPGIFTELQYHRVYVHFIWVSIARLFSRKAILVYTPKSSAIALHCYQLCYYLDFYFPPGHYDGIIFYCCLSVHFFFSLFF